MGSDIRSPFLSSISTNQNRFTHAREIKVADMITPLSTLLSCLALAIFHILGLPTPGEHGNFLSHTDQGRPEEDRDRDYLRMFSLRGLRGVGCQHLSKPSTLWHS